MEDGYGTVAAVGLILVCLLLGLAVFAAGAVVAAKARVQASADAVALAGAEARVQQLTQTAGPDPCAVAQELAQRNRVRLDQCRIEEAGVQVWVSAQVWLPSSVRQQVGEGGVRVRARARAGLLELLDVQTVRAGPAGPALTASHQHSASFPSSFN